MTRRKHRRVIRPATGGRATPTDPDNADQRAATTQTTQQTRDDTDEGWGDGAVDPAHDRWLQEQRPPHWE